MRYIPNTDADCQAMLQAIGLSSMDALFADIPKQVRLRRPLQVPPALSEADLLGHLKAMAARNADLESTVSFLGAGAYNHFVPAMAGQLLLRGEFLTCYTPYQPEVSQGTLQYLYEFQTMICLLTGMEVANATMYEGGSALAEAVLMASRVTGRREVAVARSVHPEYRRVVETYVRQTGIALREVPFAARTGAVDMGAAREALTAGTACLVVQSPNFFGGVEDLEEVGALAKAAGALFVVAVAEPVSLGLLKPPGECGADIVAGEGQPLGCPVSYGGPNLGFFATRERYIRHMPGRLVGQTVDRNGQTGYVLTLATREQHIRREKATSNICTSQSLVGLMATIFMTTMGRQGMRDLAALNLEKAAYARGRITKVPGLAARFAGPVFNEFVVSCGRRKPAEMNRALWGRRILGGVELGRYYPELADCLLFCVTEQHTREQIEGLAAALAGKAGGPGRNGARAGRAAAGGRARGNGSMARQGGGPNAAARRKRGAK
jgi:glycine dehydrogenase subunit 1